MGTTLKPFNVTICCFDPGQGPDHGETYVLPVDSPDEDHAIASTLANAASFTTKWDGSQPKAVAFMCQAISPRT